MALTNSQKVEKVACPKCGSPAGKMCRTKNGTALKGSGWPMHKERKEAYTDWLLGVLPRLSGV